MVSMVPRQGIIWKIDRFATHDGPGIRTSLYFKGCPLRCTWCSNPEGQIPEPILIFHKAKCTICRLCVEACHNQALQLRDDNADLQINRPKCDFCEACLSACSTGALEIWGKSWSIPELIGLLERDRFIHQKSGGGLTCTGGEPLYQWEFVQELLEECRKRSIHTAVETCAYVDEKPFRAMLERVDWLFIDLKHMDAKAHLALTGKGNDLILHNTRLASSILQDRRKTLVVRIVIVPGINAGQNVYHIGDFLCSLPFVSMVELLSYHSYGVYKYDLLGRTYGLKGLEPPTAEIIKKYRDILETRGLVVVR